jgi:hypothetical protein
VLDVVITVARHVVIILLMDVFLIIVPLVLIFIIVFDMAAIFMTDVWTHDPVISTVLAAFVRPLFGWKEVEMFSADDEERERPVASVYAQDEQLHAYTTTGALIAQGPPGTRPLAKLCHQSMVPSSEDDPRQVPVDRLAEELADPHLGRRDVALVQPLLGDHPVATVEQEHVELLPRQRAELDGESLPHIAR